MALKKVKGKVRFPKKELNSWLKKNPTWDHNTWTYLIDDLTEQGFEDWTGTQDGKDSIGLYLETKNA